MSVTKSLVQQQFGAHAAAYTTSAVHAKGASLSRVVELTKPQKQWRVLDVATGAGHTAAAFASHVASVVASDLTDEMLAEAAALAASKGFANMTTARADAEALPFPDASFELVACRIAAHHFPDVPTFVAEARRVLVPGGKLAVVDNISPDQISTPGFSSTELRDASLTYNAFEKIRDPSHGRCLGMAEWNEVMEDAGLEPVHAERLSKDMEFQPWAERMGADATTIQRLRAMLDGASPALAAFLKPHMVDGALWFTLDEAIMIARKPN
jgi:ubiquinone/menaquinone biosynthesis C-methylase UbiE